MMASRNHALVLAVMLASFQMAWAVHDAPTCGADGGSCDGGDDTALLQVKDAQTSTKELSGAKGVHTIGPNDYAIQTHYNTGEIYSLSVSNPAVIHYWDPKVIGSPTPQGYEEVAAIRQKANCVNHADCSQHRNPMDGYLVTYGGYQCGPQNPHPEFYESEICQEWYLIQHTTTTPPVAVPFR